MCPWPSALKSVNTSFYNSDHSQEDGSCYMQTQTTGYRGYTCLGKEGTSEHLPKRHWCISTALWFSVNIQDWPPRCYSTWVKWRIERDNWVDGTKLPAINMNSLILLFVIAWFINCVSINIGDSLCLPLSVSSTWKNYLFLPHSWR